jgi:hypothetical protein
LGKNKETCRAIGIEPSEERVLVVLRDPNEGKDGEVEYQFNEDRLMLLMPLLILIKRKRRRTEVGKWKWKG